MISTSNILAEGKTKILRPGTEPDQVRVEFKDAATAFNGQKAAEITGKGALNAKISSILFELLKSQGISTCFLQRGDSPSELIYKRLTMIPLEVVVRNEALGSVVKRFQIEEGTPFTPPLVEFFYKSHDDPLISDDLILAMKLVPDRAILEEIRLRARQINEIFVRYFGSKGIRCADFKLEFGFYQSENSFHGDKQSPCLMLGDELSPDNFRLRDSKTQAVLDKDVFRLDLADLFETYQHLLNRLEPQESIELPPLPTQTYRAEIWVHSRKNILNPESKAILEGLHHMGHSDVLALNAGKRFQVQIQAESLSQAEKSLESLAQTVLCNPVIEDYSLRFLP